MLAGVAEAEEKAPLGDEIRVGQLVSGGTQIQAGDSVVVFCHDINMSKIEKFFK